MNALNQEIPILQTAKEYVDTNLTEHLSNALSPLPQS